MRMLEAACYRQRDLNLVYTRNCYVTNTCDRVDVTANICQQFNVQCASNDFGLQRHAETRRSCFNLEPRVLRLLGQRWVRAIIRM